MLNHTSKYIGICNVIQASKHGGWSYIWHHLLFPFVEQNFMTVWLEVIAPSPLAVLCNCPSPSPLVRPASVGA